MTRWFVLAPVVAGDWQERQLVPLTRLAARVAMFRGRGKQAAGQAVTLIRPGAESRPETLVRLGIGDMAGLTIDTPLAHASTPNEGAELADRLGPAPRRAGVVGG